MEFHRRYGNKSPPYYPGYFRRSSYGISSAPRLITISCIEVDANEVGFPRHKVDFGSFMSPEAIILAELVLSKIQRTNFVSMIDARRCVLARWELGDVSPLEGNCGALLIWYQLYFELDRMSEVEK